MPSNGGGSEFKRRIAERTCGDRKDTAESRLKPEHELIELAVHSSELSLLYDLTAPIVHNGSHIFRLNPCGWTIITQDQPWAFAIAFPLRTTIKTEQRSTDLLLAVRVSLGAVQGQVDLAVLSRDRSRVLAHQSVMDCEAKRTIELFGGPIVECGDLIIRSGHAGGHGRIEIKAVDTVAVDPAHESLSRPREFVLGPVSDWSRYLGDYTDSVKQNIRSWKYLQIKQPIVMNWLMGLKLWIYPANESSRAIYVSGAYEPNTLVVLESLLRDGDVFLDAGANIGVFSLIAARVVGAGGQVFAFEPSSREWQRLRDNIELNEIANIQVVKAAVADGVGSALLHLADDRHNGQNTLGRHFAYYGTASGLEEAVDLISIDEFFRTNHIYRLDVIKLDIEGAEYRALVGGSATIARFRPIVIFESNATMLTLNGSSAEDLRRFFWDRQYQLYGICEDDASLYPITQIAWDDSTNFVAYPDEKAPPRKWPNPVCDEPPQPDYAGRS